MSNGKSYLLNLLKCVIITLIITIISILIFALLLKIFSINNVIVKPVNYLIKSLSIFVATIFSVKESKGAIKGLSYGILSTITCFIFFSIISGYFSITIDFLWDLCLGGVVGMIAGITAINIKK